MDIKKMSLEQLEQEYESNKSISQKLVEKDIRRLDINTEILKRIGTLEKAKEDMNYELIEKKYF